MAALLERIMGIGTDKRVQAATIFFIVALAAALGVPEDRIVPVTVAVGGLFALLTAIAAADGYARGKAVEGTVPEGHKPAAGNTQVIIGGVPAAGPGGPSDEDVARASDEMEAMVRRVMEEAARPKAEVTYPPGEPRGFVRTGLLACLLLPALLLFGGGGGCGALGGTSKSYQAGAQAAGQFLADETTDYAGADVSLDDGTRTQRLADAAELDAATGDRKAVTLDRTEAAWDRVRPVFNGYVDADATLDDFQRRTIRGVGERLDRLNAAEHRRRRALGPLELLGRPAGR